MRALVDSRVHSPRLSPSLLALFARVFSVSRLQYEASFVYDLMEWVHPGTIHQYVKADQNKLESPPATTVANAGVSSSLKAGPLKDEG